MAATSSVSGVAVCNDDGTWTVTWSIQNSELQTMSLTSVTLATVAGTGAVSWIGGAPTTVPARVEPDPGPPELQPQSLQPISSQSVMFSYTANWSGETPDTSNSATVAKPLNCGARLWVKKVGLGGGDPATNFTVIIDNITGANTSGQQLGGVLFSQGPGGAGTYFQQWDENGDSFALTETPLPANWTATATKILSGSDVSCDSTAAAWDTNTPDVASGSFLNTINHTTNQAVTVCFQNTYTPPPATFTKSDGTFHDDHVDWTITITNSAFSAAMVTILDENTSFLTDHSETCTNALTENPADTYACGVPGSGTDGGVASFVLSTPLPQGFSEVCDSILVENTAQDSDTQQIEGGLYSNTAQPDSSCITVEKSNSDTTEPPTWQVRITNTSNSQMGVFVVDAGSTYEGVISGTVGCTASLGADMTNGIPCTVGADGELVIAVAKTTPVGTCEGTSVPNEVNVYVGTFANGNPVTASATQSGVNPDSDLCIINVHKEAETRHNGITSPAPNDDDGWTITLDSEDCSIHLVGQTDANGNVSFSGLPLCSDYVVAEVGPNASSPGFVQVAPAGAFTDQKPESQTLTFLNRRTTFDPPCQNCGQTTTTPTATPTTPTATPITPATTATPTTPPTNAPTNAPTNTPTATSPSGGNVAGDQAANQTPVAPNAGNGPFSGGNGLNLLLVLVGIAAVSAGLSVMAMGRRR